jgi:N-acetylglutamate synthase-like GNAT family acetyltransferase
MGAVGVVSSRDRVILDGAIAMSTIQNREFRGEPLSAQALAAAAAVLTAAHLPVDDLAAEGVNLFVFRQAGEIVGYGGFERYGEDALVRSIVVVPDRRRSGLGRRIVKNVLAQARKQGAERAYLLTIDAQDYFARLGFAVVDRASAPLSILATRQAASLCPISAVLMMKSLADERGG